MLDSNIFDRLAEDPETLGELLNRRDLRPVATGIQARELAAIPDAARREALLALMEALCVTVSARRDDAPAAPAAHRNDSLIAAAAAARCDLLVSDDRGLLECAARLGTRVMDWKAFRDRVVWAPKAGRR